MVIMKEIHGEEMLGGVCIGKNYNYAGDPEEISLEIFSRKLSGSYILKGENSTGSSAITITDQGNMTLAGYLDAPKVSCPSTPNVYYSASDTTNFPTPWNTGDFFINTAAKNIYVSRGTDRGDWVMISQ